MAKPVAAILYLLTALATLVVGLASFNSIYAITSPTNLRWLPTVAFVDFAVPTVFLLASISVVSTNHKSLVPQSITAGAILLLSMLVFGHDALGWKSFAYAAGNLISAVFIIGALARRVSTIAGIGAALYAVVEGYRLMLNLQLYWAFGGSFQHLLVTVMPPVLVTASLGLAIYSHFKVERHLTSP
jgi:hypothetical protein